ncbi:partner and localizer of BRCA2 [Sceloporus undulatus]|uniref:partner and localizer of BRCA2 n=1 Tax=Sceloporus undulatus TaxID=8520 RepID=UPI001C4D2300|nr:partner and localizer of BRCA2 [Sceloporus undulatus]
MEAPRGKAPLDPEEKAQLKEKLAFLKREYRRTFHRLQRAERAERVKTYVKRTVAEQNLLLIQEENEKDREGSVIGQTALVASEEVPISTCPTRSPGKTPSITFKPEPEVFNQEDVCLLSTPVSKRTGRDCRKVLFGPVEKWAHLSKSRTRAQRRATLPLEKRAESASEALCGDVGCQPEQGAGASSGGSQSPVFKRRISSIREAMPELSVATTDGSSCESIPLVLRPECPQEASAKTRDSFPFPYPLSCESQVPSLSPPCHQKPSVSFENSARENTPSQKDLQSGRKEAALMEENQAQSGEENSDLRRFAVSSQDLEGHGTPLGVPEGGMYEEGSPGKESPASGFCSGDPPSSKSRANGLRKPLEPDSSLLEEPLPPAAPAQKVLSSCTVVEGLLFPVEYYVRTTRRMSSRQSEINLEAVIQSHLGRSKKGQKVAWKERNTELVLSSQEPVGSAGPPKAVPFSAPAASPSFQSSCESAASNRGLVQSEGRLQIRRKRRPRERSHSWTLSTSLQDPLENSEVADGSFTSSKSQGREEVGPGRGKATETPVVAGGRRRGRKGPGKGRNHEAELETILSSPVLPEADPASGFEKDLEEDCERLLWENNPSQQTGSLPCHSQRGEASPLQWLPPSNPDLQEFCLPEDEFGLLKSEKLKTCVVKEPESLTAEGQPLASEAGPEESAPGESFRDAGTSAAQETLAASQLPRHLHQTDLSSNELLFSPAPDGVSCPLQSPLPTPAFPMVGTTPASPALPASQVSPDVFCASSWQATAGDGGEPGTLAEASPSFPRSGMRRQRLQSQCRASWPAEEELESLEERLAGESLRGSSESPKQNEGEVECLVEPSLEGILGEGKLQMTSKLKSCSGSSFVDVGTVWWEAADFTALCVLTASETSVSLWRQMDDGHWAVMHTWHFNKVLVIQIIPLPGVRSLVCVALGSLEIVEIRFLFHSSEGDSVTQSSVKAGKIKAVLGLRKRRLVTSCGSLRDQEVEVASFSELGRSNERQTLMPPEETILAFADVEGMQEALVGMTATNCLVVWNLASGQLLRKMSVGCSYPASVCHRAYADLGLLFVVLSHPHAKESKACGIPAFQVVAINPKTARSATVTSLSLPLGSEGRYLEGEVRDASAAAVMTSGTIAVWDLFLGRCTAVLPPNSEGKWSLVRWSVTDTCLLAGQNDGSVYIYSYTPHLRSP